MHALVGLVFAVPAIKTVVVVTLVWVALGIIVAAAYLIVIAYLLARVNARLRGIVDGLAAVPDKTEPAGPIITRISAQLQALEEAFAALAERKGIDLGAPAETQDAQTGGPPEP
jgi:hypothetical protein